MKTMKTMKTMNVLSLFDGMSCGQIALERAGIKVNYYASEIDKYAIKVTQANYPNTIQLGDITKINGKDLPKIDLLIGGSPCQGFSFAGKQLNFNDQRSKLFFEYIRLLKECKPKYFLLENVRMKKEYQDIISNHLNVEPIKINSNLVSAQNRLRLYWTNIPDVKQPKDKKIFLKDILDNNQSNYDFYKDYQMKKWYNKEYKYKNTYVVENINKKSRTLVASAGNTGSGAPKIWYNETFRFLTVLEHERLQTVPDNYTKSVSKSQAKKMLGNGWTVDVIAHIFNNLN